MSLARRLARRPISRSSLARPLALASIAVVVGAALSAGSASTVRETRALDSPALPAREAGRPPLAAPAVATAITAGAAHACAIVAGGSVVCWGANGSGQLGDGSTTARTTPVAVAGLEGATQIAAGRNHTCALVADGRVRCWGSNADGQLGNPAAGEGSPLPVEVVGIRNVRALATGETHTCVVLSNLTPRCWGSNDHGELGPEARGRPRPAPTRVSGVENAVSIVAGDGFSCAGIRSGAVRCWGRNDHGQLGGGRGADEPVPTTVAGLRGVANLAAGRFHACAQLRSGAVRCWGWGLFGALGAEAGAAAAGPSGAGTPTTVGRTSTVVGLDAGESATCVVVETGRVRCWGANDFGGLGNGTSVDSGVPVGVVGATDVRAVAVGGGFACALIADGSIRCWGQGSTGQLGDGRTLDRSYSEPVAF